MKVLLQSVKILDAGGPHDGEECNVLISDGEIAMVGHEVAEADRVVNASGLCLSVGWCDMHAHFADPGEEHRETLESGCSAAMAGGFTHVALLPNTRPVTQTKNALAYLHGGNRERLTQVYGMGALTRDCAGEEITEMLDLAAAGAVAFSDGTHPVWHADIMLKGLQYLQKVKGLLVNQPGDVHLSSYGVMNEGVTSTMLGMKGMPKLAEELMVSRDLQLLEYAGGRLHFTGLSTARSVALVRDAKAKGLDVSCDVVAHNLLLDDSALVGFDTNLKVKPPLREAEDLVALVAGLKDGTVDAVVSGHHPYDPESKKLEFDYAEFGAIGLQTVFPVLTAIDELTVTEWLPALTTRPRELLGLPQARVAVDQKADLTLFDPGKEWTLNAATNHSGAENSPWWGKTLKGKVRATFGNGQCWIDED